MRVVIWNIDEIAGGSRCHSPSIIKGRRWSFGYRRREVRSRCERWEERLELRLIVRSLIRRSSFVGGWKIVIVVRRRIRRWIIVIDRGCRKTFVRLIRRISCDRLKHCPGLEGFLCWRRWKFRVIRLESLGDRRGGMGRGWILKPRIGIIAVDRGRGARGRRGSGNGRGRYR